MITHNGKQVTLAMRNRKAINLIARNGKAMFGEYAQWLTGIDAAAKAVILAEYGKQVWSDVRDYAIAHPQIGEFINQDPHLAASISPNSNKERWLVGDGVARIELGTMTLTAEAEIEADIMATKNGWNTPFGLNSWGSGYGIFYNQDYTIRPWWANNNYNATIAGCTWAEETMSHIKMKAGYFENNGTVYYNQAVTKTTQTAMFYLYRCGGNSNFFKGGLGVVKLQDEGTGVNFHLIPHQRPDGQCGMLDLVTYTFHPNANTQGQFTIAVTDKE